MFNSQISKKQKQTKNHQEEELLSSVSLPALGPFKPKQFSSHSTSGRKPVQAYTKYPHGTGMQGGYEELLDDRLPLRSSFCPPGTESAHAGPPGWESQNLK